MLLEQVRPIWTRKYPSHQIHDQIRFLTVWIINTKPVEGYTEWIEEYDREQKETIFPSLYGIYLRTIIPEELSKSISAG